jgi:hypothetical protein
MYDLVCPNGLFKLDSDTAYVRKKQREDGTFPRGNENIRNNSFESINGIMLANDNCFHRLVNRKTLEILNNNNHPGITYSMGTYQFSQISVP